jgi:hypothetical protein
MGVAMKAGLAMSVAGTLAMLFATGPQYLLSWDIWKKEAREWNKFLLFRQPKGIGSPLLVTYPLLYRLGFCLILIGNALLLFYG